MLSLRALFPRLTVGFLTIAALDVGVASAQIRSRPASIVVATTSPGAAMAVSSDTGVVAVQRGPRSGSVGFRMGAIAAPSVPPRNDRSLGAGKNVALMGVGIAGVITGLIVGGTSGTVIAVGGGALGFFGLYRFLR